MILLLLLYGILSFKNQKNLYESVKVDLLNAQTKLANAQKSKNQEKIDTCTNDLEETKNTFAQVEKETFLKLRDSLSVSEYKLIESLISYVETQKSFYDRGLSILNETMLDVYEFRKYAEKRRAAIESSPKLKRLTMSKQPFTSRNLEKCVSLIFLNFILLLITLNIDLRMYLELLYMSLMPMGSAKTMYLY